MAGRALTCALLLTSCASLHAERWSRQISPASDFTDWVPLPGPGPVERPASERAGLERAGLERAGFERALPPIKRQAVAEPRILSEPVFPGFARPTGFSQDFNRNFFGGGQPSNRQLYLQSVPAVPSAPQNYLTDQGFSQGNQFLQNIPQQQFGQGIRFGLAQPNFPLSQGYVGPQFTFDANPNKLRPSVISNPVRFDNAPIQKQTVQNVPMSPQAKPFNAQLKKIEAPKFVDGYRAENASDFGAKSQQKKPVSLQKMKYEVPRTEMVPPPNKAKSEREEVQLLYVPLESLNRGSFNFRPVPSSSLLNTEQYNQNPPRSGPGLKQSFAAEYQRPAPAAAPKVEGFPDQYNQNPSRPGPGLKPSFAADHISNPRPTKVEGFGTDQDFFTNFNMYKDTKNVLDQVPKYSTSSPFPTAAPITPKPKKLKPHQPPLAIFMVQESKRGTLKVGDVLASLKNAPSVAVLDSVNPASAPKVFIGPSNLNPPDNYVRFELPYLSNIEHSDKKIRQLPFFVAPLSYNTPQGFAKIPFPSPHVGSVVINSQIKDTQSVIREPHSTIPTPAASVIPNSYSTSQKKTNKLEPNTVTQKPTFSYYSTASPKTNPPSNYQSNYYSIEPQTVSTLRTPKEPQSIYQTTKAPSFVSRQPTLEPRKPEFVQRQQFAPRQPQYESIRQPETRQQDSRQPNSAPKQQQYDNRQPTPSREPEIHRQQDSRQPQYDNRQPPREPETNRQQDSRQPQYQTRQPTPREPEIRQQDSRQQNTAPRQPGSYFLRDQGQYNPSQVTYQDYKPQEPVKAFNIARPETTSTARPSVSTSTAKPSSTYPSQLLETHNPYSINQAFHFSTPLDYHNLFDEGYATPKVSPPPPPSISSAEVSSTESPTTKTSSVVTEENYVAPNYIQNYSPEIHYQSEIQSSRFPINNEYTTKPELSSEYNPSVSTVNDKSESISVSNVQETQATVGTQASNTENTRDNTQQTYEEATKSPYYQYETSNYEITKEETSQTTPSTTTTTRRSVVRNRGRPRYTTTPKSDSAETTSRTVTRRPLRERKPSPTRPRYESRTTERTSTKSDDTETTTKYSRSRVRQRVQHKNNDNDGAKDSDAPVRGKTQYKSSAGEEYFSKSKGGRTKDEDLAYQRDVLHQNYPVTIQERTSTKDIDAITDPSPRISSTRNLEPVTEVYDTENAYSYDRAAISHQAPNLNSKEETYSYDVQTETSYIPNYSSREEDYYQRSSASPVETVSSYTETSNDDVYARQTTAAPKETVSFVTEPSSIATESPSSNASNDYSTKTEETSATPELDTRIASQEEDAEENIVQTTPTYNRVRVRPGVIRQYNQGSTESSKIKTRRPAQAVTYRPAFSQRRTTMRIEEIEQDLKTKQVRIRPEVQENNRHPVYRPEPTTEPPVTTQASHEATKRTVFRRRRPSYTTTTTESSGSAETSSKKPVFEVKSRFRGRKPEKTTEKSEEATTTVKNVLHSRYSNRPRFSERFNKRPDDQEDQETNYSFNRPKYVEPEDLWSQNSFKPYNPNDIVDDNKPTTERRSDIITEEDIITARNEYEDILLTVTPATNNNNDKQDKRDITPTIEAIAEQTKTTKSEQSMSTFETMLEEMMKSLEEQDENEYSTHVVKHKGGEIGEIPPESVITSEDSERKTTVAEQAESQSEHHDVTTLVPAADESTHEEHKSRRRGFWKKVKVRPVTESIETAESQYYSNAVNHLGQTITLSKTVHDKRGHYDKPKVIVTTYKPNFQIIKDIVNADDDDLHLDDVIPVFDIPKIGKGEIKLENETKYEQVIDVKVSEVATEANTDKNTQTESYSQDQDLSTGSQNLQDSTAMDVMYKSTMTEPTPTATTTTSKPKKENDEDNEGYSFMDYLFGYTSNGNDQNDKEDSDKTEPIQNQNDDEEPIVRNRDESEQPTEESKIIQTTESSYIPEEFTATNEEKLEKDVTDLEIKRIDTTEKQVSEISPNQNKENSQNFDTATTSSFMNPSNVMSTSMSTEVSHETEICFRGKCIKTSKDIL